MVIEKIRNNYFIEFTTKEMEKDYKIRQNVTYILKIMEEYSLLDLWVNNQAIITITKVNNEIIHFQPDRDYYSTIGKDKKEIIDNLKNHLSNYYTIKRKRSE